MGNERVVFHAVRGNPFLIENCELLKGIARAGMRVDNRVEIWYFYMMDVLKLSAVGGNRDRYPAWTGAVCSRWMHGIN